MGAWAGRIQNDYTPETKEFPICAYELLCYNPRMKDALLISPHVARRVAVVRQRLAGPRASDPAGIMDVVRDLGCLQVDPISVVARTHLLVLWSRLGPYDPANLDRPLWEER